MLSQTENNQANIIEAKDLSRAFGNHMAVDQVNFSLNRGEICAFLGPNGAGKTTIIKMLTGLLEPSGGQILYEGEKYHPDRLTLKRLIGVVPQHNNIDRELTLAENLRVHGLLYNMRGKHLLQRINESLEFAGLQEHRDKPSGKLSGGMKRKLVIARALMHEPKILFLDEPTVGLDPHSRRKMWSFLARINKERNCTIFLTTHYIEEAERLAERVIFIERGKIITEGEPDSLKQSMGRYVLDIQADDIQQEFFEQRAEALNRLEQIDASVSIRQTTLEDVFLHLTGKRLNKSA
ncbi:ABC transporter ATP-binding protein [Photobacterium lipolyticum]|uniref:Multidrug ABC transporter ATP-binding protein n=1 Tax=Photobacterium lipolyticum TaxID=266810 RepID=A0A2T3N2J1_9GAMM|nr:ABC transporter ATP-binding protein [Photobacterium lipolyticum]PSW06592.1 multidrug ABC transporter ATP-binding protein [Photobacterium lipolyticum]